MQNKTNNKTADDFTETHETIAAMKSVLARAKLGGATKYSSSVEITLIIKAMDAGAREYQDDREFVLNNMTTDCR
jgi:hypothetical protein